MIRKLTIENFKSIRSLTLEPGRVSVLIGENGGGKSNILEAIAFAAAAMRDKLDHEFLASRGIRVTEPRFMHAAFESEETQERRVRLALDGDEGVIYSCSLESEASATLARWVDVEHQYVNVELEDELVEKLLLLMEQVEERQHRQGSEQTHEEKRMTSARRLLDAVAEALRTEPDQQYARDFLIYSPENSALRIFQAEGQILPLGIKGEGLFAHLKALAASEHRDKLEEIIEKLTLIDWFEGFELPEDLAPGERSIRIRDRYLAEGALFDQRSANEGFLFLLFYFTLLVSPDTPRFFAIDNIDTSLNPKLCSALTRELVDLAKKHDKQVILTTHNPAILDGLDLHDDEQRLFVVSRNQHGHTRAHRVSPPQSVNGELPMKLSEAFLGGYIGGLPKNF